jgi:hypothetical protein
MASQDTAKSPADPALLTPVEGEKQDDTTASLLVCSLFRFFPFPLIASVQVATVV